MDKICNIKEITEILDKEKYARAFDKMQGWRNVDLEALRDKLRESTIIELLPFEAGTMLVIEDTQGKVFVVDLFADTFHYIHKVNARRYASMSKKKWDPLVKQIKAPGDCQRFHAQILELKP